MTTARDCTRSHAPQRPVIKLLRVRAVAERLDVSEKTIRRLIDRGEVTPTWIGRNLRIAEDDLQTYLNRCRK